jgi:hypothetical protein
MSRRTRLAGLLSALAVAALAAWAWRGVLDLALLGWDSYPLILAGRVTSLGDLADTFGEELMDGAYPLGRFWRPVVHLAFALDHALWGLQPGGYHATDLALLALCGAALLHLARRLLGRGAWLAPLVAAVAHVLHPVQLEILPVAARRAEALAVLFSLLALLAQPLPGQAQARAWLAGACCALALASKETGAMATGFVLALALAAADDASPVRRLALALRAAAPSLALFAATFAGRAVVLGGLGGSPESSLAAGLAAAPDLLRRYLGSLVAPRASFPETSPVVADALIVLLVVVLVVLARSRASEPRPGHAPPPLAPARVALLLLLGVAVVAVITGASGVERGWYALPFLPLLALSAALALDLGLRALARGPRVAGAVAVLLIARLVGVPVFAVSRADARAADVRAGSGQRG